MTLGRSSGHKNNEEMHYPCLEFAEMTREWIKGSKEFKKDTLEENADGKLGFYRIQAAEKEVLDKKRNSRNYYRPSVFGATLPLEIT